MEQTDESKIHYEGINSDQLGEEITEIIDFMFKTKVHEFHFASFPIDTIGCCLSDQNLEVIVGVSPNM